MIKRLVTRILDKFAGLLVRVPPIYARMLREITANPQAFHQVLNEDKVFKRIKGQKGFLSQLASDPKTVAALLKQDAALESFFNSRTAPAMILNWLEDRDSEKVPPFFQATVRAMLEDDEMLDELLSHAKFIERVTLSMEALEAVDPYGLSVVEGQNDEHKAADGAETVADAAYIEDERYIDPAIFEQRSQRAAALMNSIAKNAPSSYRKYFVLEHDDILTEIISSHATTDELLRNAEAYLGDITFTAEHRRSLYVIIAAMVSAKPGEVAREFFGEPVEALGRDITVSQRFLSALSKSNRGPIYHAFDDLLQRDSKSVRLEYLRDRIYDLVSGPMKADFADVFLNNIQSTGSKLADNRKARIISDLAATMKPSSLNWVFEEALGAHPEAVADVARMPAIIDYYARDGWTNFLQRARMGDSGRTLGDLFRMTAHDAPDAFLSEFIEFRPDWIEKAASTETIRQAVLANLGEDDGAVLRDQVFEPSGFLKELSLHMPAETHAQLSELAKLSTALRKLAEFVPAEAWRKGVRAAAQAKVPSLAAFWGGIEENGEIPLLEGTFKMPSRTDMAMITDEILLREEYFLAEYGPEDKPYIIDCGTNIGLSIAYVKAMYPNATVLGFEPVEELRTIAEANMTSLGFEKVTILPNAIAGEAGRRRLRTSLENTLAGSITDRMDRKTGRTTEDFVEAKTLSEFIKGPVDFIKLDIEGVEHEVFLEAKDKLHMVRYIFCEFHYDGVRSRQKFEDILKVLAEAGFVYHIARTPWAEERYAHRPLSYVGQAFSVSIYAKNTTWPPQIEPGTGK